MGTQSFYPKILDSRKPLTNLRNIFKIKNDIKKRKWSQCTATAYTQIELICSVSHWIWSKWFLLVLSRFGILEHEKEEGTICVTDAVQWQRLWLKCLFSIKFDRNQSWHCVMWIFVGSYHKTATYSIGRAETGSRLIKPIHPNEKPKVYHPIRTEAQQTKKSPWFAVMSSHL